jgi:predicted NUDIX family NTP pyrophosphohydrolase
MVLDLFGRRCFFFFERSGRIMRESAGTLLYRGTGEQLEVLLVHPSGAYNRQAPWSIPKGVPNEQEPNLEETARRETEEETGVKAGALTSLGNMEYRKSRKRIHCFAGPAPEAAAPVPASWEVDQARFVPLAEARRILHPDQCVFLDRLVEQLDPNKKRTADERR